MWPAVADELLSVFVENSDVLEQLLVELGAVATAP
jgi:hypothetical protein